MLLLQIRLSGAAWPQSGNGSSLRFARWGLTSNSHSGFGGGISFRYLRPRLSDPATLAAASPGSVVFGEIEALNRWLDFLVLPLIQEQIPNKSYLWEIQIKTKGVSNCIA